MTAFCRTSPSANKPGISSHVSCTGLGLSPLKVLSFLELGTLWSQLCLVLFSVVQQIRYKEFVLHLHLTLLLGAEVPPTHIGPQCGSGHWRPTVFCGGNQTLACFDWMWSILVSGRTAARGGLMALTQRTLTGKSSWLEFGSVFLKIYLAPRTKSQS